MAQLIEEAPMNNSTKNLGLALGAAFAASLVASPVAQAFQLQDMAQGYEQVVDQKDPPKEEKEGTCGEGKCGAEPTEGEDADKDKEGSCGEGKCGEGKCGGAA
jgi:uncharacterized low-complexity protein